MFFGWGGVDTDIDRPYVTRSEGDRKLYQIEHFYKTTTFGIQRYPSITEWMLNCVKDDVRNFKTEFQVGFKVKINYNTPSPALKTLQKTQMLCTKYRTDS